MNGCQPVYDQKFDVIKYVVTTKGLPSYAKWCLVQDSNLWPIECKSIALTN